MKCQTSFLNLDIFFIIIEYGQIKKITSIEKEKIIQVKVQYIFNVFVSLFYATFLLIKLIVSSHFDASKKVKLSILF